MEELCHLDEKNPLFLLYNQNNVYLCGVKKFNLLTI